DPWHGKHCPRSHSGNPPAGKTLPASSRPWPPAPPTSPSRQPANPAGAVALRGIGAAEIVNRGWSDRHDQLIEGSRDPQVYCFLGSEFVVAAADVLDEGVPGGDYSCAAELFEPAHRSQSGLQPSVIGFDRVVSVLLGDMAGGRHQLVEYPRIGGRVISGHLNRGRPVFQGTGEESPGGQRVGCQNSMRSR